MVRRRQLFHLYWIIPLALFLIYFHVRGMTFADEGYILHSASRILLGDVPYRDFHFTYTPGSIFASALSFLLFGQSVFASRVIMAVISFITAFFLFLLLHGLTKNKLYSILGVLLYIVWGPLHTNFAWPVMFCLAAVTVSLYVFLRGIETTKKHFFFLAGVLVFVCFLFKQNFFPALLIPFLLQFLLTKKIRTKELFLFFVSGGILSGILFSLYLLLTGSLVPFFQDLYLLSYERIVVGGDVSTPFFYGEGITRFVKALMYLSPGIISLMATLLAFRFTRKYTFIPFSCLLLYILGIRPTTDYVHLTPLLAMSGIPVVMMMIMGKSRYREVSGIVFLSLLILFGFFSGLSRGYYRWGAPLKDQNSFVSLPRAHIWLDEKQRSMTKELISRIQERTKPGEYIFTNEYYPTFYFLSERRNPTKHDLLTSNIFYTRFTKEVVQDLQAKHVALIITERGGDNSFLTPYIRQHYEKTAVVDKYEIWQKK